jgi:cytochrome c oxidase subunit 4
MKSGLKKYLYAWGALMLLLALSTGSAYLQMGAWNSVANLGISIIKAMLVALLFMHLRTSGALVRLVAVVSVFILSLLFIVSAADYLTRGMHGAEWQIPKMMQPSRP